MVPICLDSGLPSGMGANKPCNGYSLSVLVVSGGGNLMEGSAVGETESNSLCWGLPRTDHVGCYSMYVCTAYVMCTIF